MTARLENEFGTEGSSLVAEAREKTIAQKLLKNAARKEVGKLEVQLETAKARSATRMEQRDDALGRESALKDEIEQFHDMERDCSEMKALLQSVPNFEPARAKGSGRGAASYPLEFRKLVWGQLARGTPPSAVAANLVQAIKATAKWAKVSLLYCLLYFTAYCLLLTAYCLLPTAYLLQFILRGILGANPYG